ncbi:MULTISPECIES: ribosome-associated translation inhibitor RaiA [Nitrosomonas]|uniref:Ribosome hibernation promoting factor n=1 Tax=Nitrosomonas europaea (strain ATCC 19718 / CIP 103999 / KCTC 2705 / NBRC 14298) TaxID=228410 RepID=Q82Y28_NITEU|nr:MULTISPECIES: ribosome-associated translation inhibitor RaiA [Nitrosomonas]MCE7916347.1 ribosome-associated translation inhibitor RaiA [Nitrosomonas sp. PRO5]MDL1865465.1 ribosome-associated translation inhibitor RaiA [Betaproteobacteria bacterium PRO5]MBC6962127.1 ribosome-associated translation inhibitor RaiA [Nitrosomonas sp.]MBV6389293.1 Ribosome hibernation promoting factor [Nitrosomonas europaea]MEB2332394.1 ribosome-associated translation inhibitor RaiA [Nitrosomonas sp.]
MNLNLTGNHVEITPAMRDYVLSKIERITRHFDNIIDINVILSVDKLKQKAEATVNLRGKEIFVEADGLDMYASIDNLVDKLDRQILKYKEKNIDRRDNQGGLKDQEFEQSE